MEPRFRSRSAKRIKKTTPSGKRVIHYRRKKPKVAHCANCGAILHGVPRGRIIDIAKLSKTEKRPERIFGGVLCAKCVKEKIKAVVRR